MAELVEIWRCTICRAHQRFRKADLTLRDGPPQHCGASMRWVQTREWKDEEHGWSTGQRAPHIGFRQTHAWEIPVGDGSAPVYAESLRDIRRLESESAKQEADGVGQAMRFRAFSQDRSNMGDHTFGAPPQRKPNLYRDGRQIIQFVAIDDEAAADAEAAEMGPGAREDLASALKIDPV